MNILPAKEFPLKRQENKEAVQFPICRMSYRLGNRSALEWVIDQYRVNRDVDGEIVSDPNRLDDERYIVRLIGQVVHVSVETLKVIRKLPELKFP